MGLDGAVRWWGRPFAVSPGAKTPTLKRATAAHPPFPRVSPARLPGGLELDRTLYPFHRTGGVVPAALLINAGNDGSGAVQQFERIARGFPLRLMVPSTIIVGPIGAAERGRAYEWGEGLAEGVSLGIF